jgi:uncharacterized membrane protein
MHLPHCPHPKIDWKLYFKRKVIILGGVVVMTYALEHLGIHQKAIETVHEFTATVFFEHIFIGIPFGSE